MGGNARHGGADVASLDHRGRLPRLRGPRKRASRRRPFLAWKALKKARKAPPQKGPA
jgi:hypothetical protein